MQDQMHNHKTSAFASAMTDMVIKGTDYKQHKTESEKMSTSITSTIRAAGRICLMAALFIVTAIGLTGATVPKQISFQAVLTDATGAPLANQTLSLEFEIFDSEEVGTSIWGPETVAGVETDANGIVQVTLGETIAIEPEDMAERQRYLQISIAGEPPFEPRTRLLSVPFAMHSATVQKIDQAQGGEILSDVTLSGQLTLSEALCTATDTDFRLQVNGRRALKIQYSRGPNHPSAISYDNQCPSLIGGHPANDVADGVNGATIGGGGWKDDEWSVDYHNKVTDNFGTVGGGSNNRAGYYGSVPGGLNCRATGEFSFAGGRNAYAQADGSFLWGDDRNDTVKTSVENQFKIRAEGGVLLGGGVDSRLEVENANHEKTITLDGATGTTSTCVLEITGGCDLAEPFEMSPTSAIEAGDLVVIDPMNAGQVRLSTEAYDQRVAGIISGAGGVNPGLTLSQQGLMDGGRLVALTGRVYCKATAINGAIQPGDLLTTSPVAGHAMKATDRDRSHGAIIGKAMTVLNDGEGLVLVLVNLQ